MTKIKKLLLSAMTVALMIGICSIFCCAPAQSAVSQSDAAMEKVFNENFDIGMDYANEFLEEKELGNVVAMCRCADLALKHLENAEKNMDHLNAEFYEQKLDLISGINDVKVILYYEKGKIDIEFYNDIDTGISNLRNALNVNPNYSAELMLAGAKSSINRGEYKFAAIYLSEIVNCSEVAAMFRREAQQYQSKIPAGY